MNSSLKKRKSVFLMKVALPVESSCSLVPRNALFLVHESSFSQTHQTHNIYLSLINVFQFLSVNITSHYLSELRKEDYFPNRWFGRYAISILWYIRKKT